MSRIPQSLPLAARVELWFTAVERYLRDPPIEHVFEVVASGELVAWDPLRSRDGAD